MPTACLTHRMLLSTDAEIIKHESNPDCIISQYNQAVTPNTMVSSATAAPTKAENGFELITSDVKASPVVGDPIIVNSRGRNRIVLHPERRLNDETDMLPLEDGVPDIEYG